MGAVWLEKHRNGQEKIMILNEDGEQITIDMIDGSVTEPNGWQNCIFSDPDEAQAVADIFGGQVFYREADLLEGMLSHGGYVIL